MPSGETVRYHQRWLLVSLLSLGQLACLVAGVLWFAHAGNGQLCEQMRLRALRENQVAAFSIADELSRRSPEFFQDRSAYAVLLPAMSEQTQRRKLERCIWIVERSTGAVLARTQCCDDRAVPMPNQILSTVINSSVGGVRVADVGSNARPEVSGFANFGEGPELCAVRDVALRGVKIIVGTADADVLDEVRHVTARLTAGGMLVALGVAAFGTLVLLAIVQRYEHRLTSVNSDLRRAVEDRGIAALKARDAVIFGLARLAESRDDDTGEHLDRIRAYAEILAGDLAERTDEVDRDFVARIGLCSSLHDIGKVGVPDAVLLKPGALTPQERDVIRKHTTIGGDTLMAIRERLPDDPFIEMACEITFAHHERWDGKGYPFGLAGSEIPLAARIVALADVYDALTTPRVYKPAFSHERARQIILEGIGTQFDPQVVYAFLRQESRFEARSGELAQVASRRMTPCRMPVHVAATIATDSA